MGSYVYCSVFSPAKARLAALVHVYVDTRAREFRGVVIGRGGCV